MNRCAFPGCSTPILAEETGTILAEVCHIRAQNAQGPRYDPNQSDEERHGFDNLVLMCRNHHKEIDANENLHVFTVNRLVEIKLAHEQKARESGDELAAAPNVIKALQLTATVYESGSFHQDFSNATFKIGGEGGLLGGQGGHGGSLTIVGMVIPQAVLQAMNIDGRGGAGQAPGAGGGGGGAIRFEGRQATESDLTEGLHVPIFFPADRARVADSLLYVLGGGWECCWVPNLPCQAPIDVVFMVEFGTIEMNALLKFEIFLKNPEGVEQVLGSRNAAADSTNTVKRFCVTALLEMDVDTVGVYELGLRSGNLQLARYPFEVKLMAPGWSHATGYGV